MLFALEDEGHGRGAVTVAVAVAATMPAFRVAQQHVETLAWQIVSEQAVFKINDKRFDARVSYVSPIRLVAGQALLMKQYQ